MVDEPDVRQSPTYDENKSHALSLLLMERRRLWHMVIVNRAVVMVNRVEKEPTVHCESLYNKRDRTIQLYGWKKEAEGKLVKTPCKKRRNVLWEEQMRYGDSYNK
jgi:hypothetical protein